ncbi:uncharacterized protein SCDLUD_004638 [Saccharomycodes ludwigii]|uniref:uncharacterized protein n=1 Tax=Saccharomycodes ludwigii TaxID=36035 RepID=UPI001E8BF62D|nr:hypothetical protein SCDLUD_004638 [Saccharomycodes ludwigii]KAH3899207.1 hypothetical protein SCDLUD_004638 [Saccharomycodes ludwigii]
MYEAKSNTSLDDLLDLYRNNMPTNNEQQKSEHSSAFFKNKKRDQKNNNDDDDYKSDDFFDLNFDSLSPSFYFKSNNHKITSKTNSNLPDNDNNNAKLNYSKQNNNKNPFSPPIAQESFLPSVSTASSNISLGSLYFTHLEKNNDENENNYQVNGESRGCKVNNNLTPPTSIFTPFISNKENENDKQGRNNINLNKKFIKTIEGNEKLQVGRDAIDARTQLLGDFSNDEKYIDDIIKNSLNRNSEMTKKIDKSISLIHNVLETTSTKRETTAKNNTKKTSNIKSKKTTSSNIFMKILLYCNVILEKTFTFFNYNPFYISVCLLPIIRLTYYYLISSNLQNFEMLLNEVFTILITYKFLDYTLNAHILEIVSNHMKVIKLSNFLIFNSIPFILLLLLASETYIFQHTFFGSLVFNRIFILSTMFIYMKRYSELMFPIIYYNVETKNKEKKNLGQNVRKYKADSYNKVFFPTKYANTKGKNASLEKTDYKKSDLILPENPVFTRINGPHLPPITTTNVSNETALLEPKKTFLGLPLYRFFKLYFKINYYILIFSVFSMWVLFWRIPKICFKVLKGKVSNNLIF